jgi:hypothetical protein
MRRGITLILGSILLSACTNCRVASFYKALPEGSPQLSASSELPTVMRFAALSVPVTVSVCGGGAVAAPRETITLCIALELGEATSVRFVEPRLAVVVGDTALEEVQMTAIEYEVYCRVEKGERICTSSEEPPIVGTVHKVAGTAPLDKYTFDPALEFRGAKDTLHEGQWFGYRLSGERLYFVRVAPVAVNNGVEFTVRLPQMLVNGQKFSAPILKFRAVTEEICRAVPLS